MMVPATRQPRVKDRLLVKLRDVPDESTPAYLDVHYGAREPATALDLGGRLDRTVHRRCSAMRVCNPFHASSSFGDLGNQHCDYNDTEHRIGLSRTRAVRVDNPDQVEAVVNDLRALDEVEWAVVEPLCVAPLEAAAADVTGQISAESILRPYRQVGALDLPDSARPPASHRVAVIDTGIALDHEELRGRLGPGCDTVDLGPDSVAHGITLAGDVDKPDFHPMDLFVGHGTHIAGILGARGIHLPPGVCGDATILPIRSMAAATTGDGRYFGVGGLMDLDCGIKSAVDMGARTLNMSFGTPADLLDAYAPFPHDDVIEYAISKGVIPVAANGNSGTLEEYYPATLPNVIAVASVDDNNQVSTFSTRGAHVDIAAPGERIVGLGLEGYRLSTGTSHAAPFVVGAVTILDYEAQKHGVRLTLSMARDALRSSATHKPADGPDNAVGYGVLNIPGALNQLQSSIRGAEAHHGH